MSDDGKRAAPNREGLDLSNVALLEAVDEEARLKEQRAHAKARAGNGDEDQLKCEAHAFKSRRKREVART